jgi:hypothetical protein
VVWACCGGGDAGATEQMVGQSSSGATSCWGSSRVLEGLPVQRRLGNSKIDIVCMFKTPPPWLCSP